MTYNIEHILGGVYFVCFSAVAWKIENCAAPVCDRKALCFSFFPDFPMNSGFRANSNLKTASKALPELSSWTVVGAGRRLIYNGWRLIKKP